ncbi:isocitrate lyase/phosphoenolpyruvate mutase family protein [Streptomyces sp. NBC_00859]|uniref:isocitrate lyase/phosphoenolpyruvate mutase family protein n=1 Tax=Streptomyces sp. NBC_00859 TaxID=2903682 RepID=UPI00386F1621|nr:isocitrate lyase/phosphoenolpyruvate mutase family protein [Streptomyces sp. NBC_00859]
MGAATTEIHRASGTSGARRLRELFARPGAVRLAGAHNPLGARLAQRAGFDGVWSSGLEVSASQGVPDTDILTMSELLGVASSLTAAVDVPVVADCDAGYGNAHNVMHMIRRYEAAGIAAVSIEDKRFPKVNSFIPGRQELAPVLEFCGKLTAAKAAQRTPDLMVIARIEALIAGWGMDEALSRGEAYARAGADAVLIHAKGSSPEPILDFLAQWTLPTPVVVVPTTYHTITATELAAAGAKMVIYANHGLRAGIAAMTDTFASILRDDRTTGIEDRIAPLATVFDLQGMAEQKVHEQEFITSYESRTRAVVLPGPADATPPSLQEHRTAALRRSGADDITVTGTPGEPSVVEALLGLTEAHHGPTLVVCGDALVEAGPLRLLTAAEADVAVLADVSATPRRDDGLPLSISSMAQGGRRLVPGGGAEVVSTHEADANAEFAGAAVFSPQGFAALRTAAEKRRADAAPATLGDLIADLLAAGQRVRAVEIASGWMELRTAGDSERAAALFAAPEAGR